MMGSDAAKERVRQLAALERELEQRKVREAIRYYKPHAKQEAFHAARARVRVFSAGNQCLSGRTPIFDPLTLESLPVEERVGKPFHVIAYTEAGVGIYAVPEGAFVKPDPAMMFDTQVETVTGARTIRTTADHRVYLRDYGWVPVRFLRRGQVLGAPKGVTLGVVAEDPVEAGVEEVYDLTVPGPHCYYAEGVLHHNTGKTTAGVAEDVAWALGYRPWLPASHSDYIVKKAGATQAWEPVRVPTTGIIIGQTNDTLRRVQLASLLGDPGKGTPGLLPMDEVAETRKNQVGIITWIKLKNGSEIHLMTYEQDPMVFEGWRVNWVHADEPPPRGIYIAVWRGLAAKLGSLWLTMTPIAEPWVFDELMSKPDTAVIYATTADNVGYGMTEKGLRDWEAALSEDEREARLLGRPIHLRGLVYKEFDKRVHCVKRERVDVTGEDVEKWMHVDPHRQKRHRAVWVAKFRDGRYVVCGELDARSETNLISDFADDIRAYEKNVLKWRHNDVRRLIDPYAKEPGVTDTGASVKDEFQARGMFFNIGSKDRTSAIHIMHELLRHFPERGLYPNLYVMDDLNKTVFEFEHYIFDDGPRGQDLSGQVAKPKKVYDDSLEGIHRVVLASYVPDEAEDEDEDYRTVARAVGPRRGY